MSGYQEIINQVESGDVEGLIDLSNLEAPDFNALGDFDSGAVDSNITFGIPDKKRAEDFKPIALESINDTQKEKEKIIFDTQCKSWESMGPNGVCEVTKRKVDRVLENNSLQTYTNIFSEYKGKIRTSKDLKRACSKLGINVKDLQKNIGTKADGVIGKNTFREFKNKILKLKNTNNINENIEDGGNLVNIARKYIGKTESNRGLRNEIKSLITELDGNRNFDISKSKNAWCAAFVRLILKKAGKVSAAKNMTNAALSAFGINQTGYHIGISTGGGRFIDGNSGKSTNKVTQDSIHRGYRKRGYIGWISPENIGNKNAVNGDRKPPKNAIIVFGRGSNASQKAKKMRRHLNIA